MFSQKTFDFLFQNRLINSREWFLEHKAEYQNYVLQPLTDLSVLLAPTVSAIDDLIITEPKVDRTISRIYRDTRFSKDKLLYREEMWLSFRRNKKAYPNYPEFFFVITPGEFLYGSGYYSASPEVMDTIRELILKKDPMFLKALKVYEKQTGFIMEGDLYKRTKYPEQPENIRTWLDRKCICFMYKSSDFSQLFSDGLPDKIIKAYKEMAPLYNFFIYAESRTIK